MNYFLVAVTIFNFIVINRNMMNTDHNHNCSTDNNNIIIIKYNVYHQVRAISYYVSQLLVNFFSKVL